MYSLHSDEVTFTREVYNILDLIGDLGGLFDGLNYIVQICLFLIDLMGKQALAAYIIKRVFVKT